MSLGRATPSNGMLFPFSALTLLAWRQEGHPAGKNLSVGMFGGDDLTGVCMSSSSSAIILAPIKSRMEAFGYQLTGVVLENGRLE